MASLSFSGIAASPGIAVGKVRVFVKRDDHVTVRHDVDVADEQNRFKSAVAASLRELEQVFSEAKARLGEKNAQIFEAHQLVLQDPEFFDAVMGQIQSDVVNAEAALQAVTQQLVAIFGAMDNEYISQRAADIRDVSDRVLAHLLESEFGTEVISPEEPVILVAHDLAPSDTLQINSEHVLAFVTEVGGRTSHTAIISRSIGLPAVVGLKDAIVHVQDSTQVIVDGIDGKLIVNPTNEEISNYEQKRKHFIQHKATLEALLGLPTTTIDGVTVELGANISTPDDILGVIDNGAEGIGLFRTEFLYMNRNFEPSEEDQFEAYKSVVSAMDGKPVIIRTLDIGGDKQVPYLGLPLEINPFLGYRAIRLCLDRTDLFETQLRAIVRASHYGNLKIMYPMIATLAEVRQANQILEHVKEQLRAENIPFDPDIEVGIMVEIPAAAIAANVLAKEVDFFSIGTNDLIQYTMACDRLNEKIAYLYQPYHPALLRLLKWVIDAAHAQGKWVGMCGELAGDPIAIPILLGMGLDEFSMSSSSVLPTRELIRSLSSDRMRNLAVQVLELDDQEQVKALVEKSINQ